MSRKIIIDTSVIVSLLNKRDFYHEWTKGILEKEKAPFFTCEAVMTETYFLLKNVYGARDAVMGLLNDKLLQIPFRLEEESEAVAQLMSRYQSVPMSLADGCLVRMSELYANSEILTLDSDFTIYRQHRNRIIPVILP